MVHPPSSDDLLGTLIPNGWLRILIVIMLLMVIVKYSPAYIHPKQPALLLQNRARKRAGFLRSSLNGNLNIDLQ